MILAVLIWAAFPSPAQAILDVGDTIYFHSGCDKASIEKVVQEDKISRKRGTALFDFYIEDGSCHQLNFPWPLKVAVLKEVYTQGETGLIIEVWKMDGPGDIYALIVSDPQPSSLSI